MEKAFQEYESLRAQNLTPNVISVALKAVLREDAINAYSECKQFDDHIKGQEKEVTEAFKDCSTKYPHHAEYLKLLFDIDNVKGANIELSMLKDAIKCLEMKMELMKDNVKENGNLLNVLKQAI